MGFGAYRLVRKLIPDCAAKGGMAAPSAQAASRAGRTPTHGRVHNILILLGTLRPPGLRLAVPAASYRDFEPGDPFCRALACRKRLDTYNGGCAVLGVPWAGTFRIHELPHIKKTRPGRS